MSRFWSSLVHELNPEARRAIFDRAAQLWLRFCHFDQGICVNVD